MIGRDPDDAGRQVLASIKCNLAPEPDSLAYSVQEAPGGAPRLVWHGVSRHTAWDLLGLPGSGEPRTRQLDAAQTFLRGQLANGPVAAAELEGAAEAAGVSNATLRRAKGEMDVRSVRQGTTWRWKLPD